MNSFYALPLFSQWLIAIVLALVGFYPAILLIELGYGHTPYYLLFFFFVPIAQFCVTPLFRLAGIYTYYSPMLLGYMANDKKIDLHSGTSFDYLLVMPGTGKGIQTRDHLLSFYLQGLLFIIEKIETNSISENVQITAVSYFFNNRTISRFGFSVRQPPLFYRLNIFINYIDLFWMFSISKGRLQLPPLRNIKQVEIPGYELVKYKRVILVTYQYLLASE